jgi:hypothetical protein
MRLHNEAPRVLALYGRNTYARDQFRGHWTAEASRLD